MRIIFRADGNSEIGLGHVMRLLALAEILKDDFDCYFAIQHTNQLLKEKIVQVCNKLIELPAHSFKGKVLVGELENYIKGDEIVVLDGYAFDTDYQNYLKHKGCALVCIDDIHAYHFVADVVINHTGGIAVDKYSLEAYTKCYLGPAYALLRPPFLGAKNEDGFIKEVRNLFINMGGADPENHTCQILNQIKDLKFFNEIHIVTGAAYKYRHELDNFIQENKSYYLHTNLDAEAMASLMKKCGVAICPPSSVSYEYASLGGLLFLKQIAANQTEVKAYFLSNHLAFDFDNDFGETFASDPEQAQKNMMQVQRTIMDGKSNERLKAIFNKLDLTLNLTLRPVKQEDMFLCYEWANDTETRAFSYNSETIPLEVHQRWFNKKIQNETSKFYIAEVKGEPVGQVRFEGNKEKQISYLIAPEKRGLGLGYEMLKKGVGILLQVEPEVRKVLGYVKKSNIASCKIFEKAGFKTNSVELVDYPDSFKYELNIKP